MKQTNKTTDEHKFERMIQQASCEFAREIMRGLMEAVVYTRNTKENLK